MPGGGGGGAGQTLARDRGRGRNPAAQSSVAGRARKAGGGGFGHRVVLPAAIGVEKKTQGNTPTHSSKKGKKSTGTSYPWSRPAVGVAALGQTVLNKFGVERKAAVSMQFSDSADQ